MMKPESNYKMSSALKTRLALGKWKNADQKNSWKRMMIDAELSAIEASKRMPKEKSDKD